MLMLPWVDIPGSLETLCFSAMCGAHDGLEDCVRGFGKCTGVDTWDDPPKQSKMQMQCGIASLCRTDPNSSLAYVWSKAKEIVPLDSPVFDQVSDLLAAFRDPDP